MEHELKTLPPTSQAARLREMAEEIVADQAIHKHEWIKRGFHLLNAEFVKVQSKYSSDAAALLAGAEALEAWEEMRESGFRLENYCEVRWCYTNEVFTKYCSDTPLWAVRAAIEGERRNQMGKSLGHRAYDAYWGVGHWESWSELTKARQQHWENAAAAVAAEVRREMGWRPIAEAPENKWLIVGKYNYLGWVIDINVENLSRANGYTHYLPQPDPPPQEPEP